VGEFAPVELIVVDDDAVKMRSWEMLPATLE